MTDIDLESLAEIQREVAGKVILKDRFSALKLIGGVDQAFFANNVISCIAVLDYDSMKVVDRAHAIEEVKFPYLPGYLYFREAPAIFRAFSKLRQKPDILIVDGCGINHPRKAGLASHIGVDLDLPTIGVSKRPLCGEVRSKPEHEGEFSYMEFEGRKNGALLLSRQKCRPIAVAPGHRISLDSAIRIVKHCLRGHKLPEPLRLAHSFANEMKRPFI